MSNRIMNMAANPSGSSVVASNPRLGRDPAGSDGRDETLVVALGLVGIPVGEVRERGAELLAPAAVAREQRGRNRSGVCARETLGAQLRVLGQLVGGHDVHVDRAL